jgi:ribonuclease J
LSKLSFYAGVDEIGGNKILLEDKDTRIFLDFGKSFSARKKFYDWTNRPRIINGIGDLLSLGIVPDVNGIYRQDLLTLANRWDSDQKDVSIHGVVLSHAHADHADHISLLREDIPLWMGQMTKKVIESIEDERYSDIEFEITRFKGRPINPKDDNVIERKITTFRTSGNNEFTIDSISITPIHVDHSIPGCYGLVIRTSDATIVYSGDLRTHGNKSELTKDFIAAAKDAKPDLMLCEGTRIDETSTRRESDVLNSCKAFVEQAKNSFVFADYSYKDIDRLVTFFQVAKQTGRKLLISAKTARYIRALSNADPNLGLPSPDDLNMGIYVPREGKHSKQDLPLYSQTNAWTAQDVKAKESQVIASIGSYSADELIDIKPTNGLYIHSMSEPSDEEGEISEERTRQWMLKFGLEVIHSHSSGHASGLELMEIINEISPKAIIPIHTEHAALFSTLFGAKVRTVTPKQVLEFHRF